MVAQSGLVVVRLWTRRIRYVSYFILIRNVFIQLLVVRVISLLGHVETWNILLISQVPFTLSFDCFHLFPNSIYHVNVTAFPSGCRFVYRCSFFNIFDLCFSHIWKYHLVPLSPSPFPIWRRRIHAWTSGITRIKKRWINDMVSVGFLRVL